MSIYQTSDKIITRIINGELIVIQLDTGRYHYFSNDTKEFLESFKDGMSVEGFDLSQRKEIQDLVDVLLEREILKKASASSKPLKNEKKSRTLPRFLRDGEKTLDQISFASP